MDQDVDVAAGEAERRGDVLARALLEQAQRDHRALDLAELLHARAQADHVLGVGQQLFDVRLVQGELVVPREVGDGAEVPAPLVSRRVAHDGPERRARELVVGLVVPHQERAQRVLHALQRLFGVEPLAPRDGDERPSIEVNETAQAVETVFHLT